MFHDRFDTTNAIQVERANSADALFGLGMLYASGREGSLDLVAAHKWFNLAAMMGRADAIALRREVAEQMSEAEIARAQREARAWMTFH